jgi:hypothetical protein
MADPMTGPIARCPWCSAPLVDAAGEACPACGATLVTADGAEPQLPGVTTIDAQAILRARSEVARPRGRLLSFITGEAPEDTGPGSPGSLAPPSDEVRREMLRLQLAAELAELESEAAALEAQVRLEGRGPVVAEEGATPAEDLPNVVGAPAAVADAPADPPEDRSAL